jgi:hypothetical protein
MLTLNDFINNKSAFDIIRNKIIENGVEQPFFDKEAVWGNYCLEQNSYEMTALILFLIEKFPFGMTNYLEIGSASGGFMRTIFEEVKFKTGGSIDNGKWREDVWPKNLEAMQNHGAQILRFTGDSHSENCFHWMKGFVSQYYPNFVFIDGDHSYEGVCKDIEMVLRICPKGTLVGFHDLLCERVPGVAKAFAEKVEGTNDFKILAKFINEDAENKMGVAVCRII